MKEAAQIIFMTIMSTLILKNKYFIHNIISLVIFIFLCLIIDYILHFEDLIEYFEFVPFIFEYCITIIVESALLIYEKYMMETLFYSQWNISFAIGLILFVANSFTFIYILTIGKNKKDDPFANSFYDYFTKSKVLYIIIQCIIGIIFQLIYNILKYLTVYNFLINHLLISYELSKIAKILVVYEDKKKYYCIILFVLQFIFLMIYLEIIELNFCGLSHNTRKNIQFREITERTGEEITSRDSLVEVSPGYYITLGECLEKFEGDEKVGKTKSKKEIISELSKENI